MLALAILRAFCPLYSGVSQSLIPLAGSPEPKQTKEYYQNPLIEVFEMSPEAIICQSPGAGGSEGTGNEPGFAPLLSPFDELF